MCFEKEMKISSISRKEQKKTHLNDSNPYLCAEF